MGYELFDSWQDTALQLKRMRFVEHSIERFIHFCVTSAHLYTLFLVLSIFMEEIQEENKSMKLFLAAKSIAWCIFILPISMKHEKFNRFPEV